MRRRTTSRTSRHTTRPSSHHRHRPPQEGQLLLRDVTVSYNRVPAVHHVSFHLDPMSCAGLIGPNGAGKTTLLKAVGGLLSLETGEIFFGGSSLKMGTSAGMRETIAYVPQRESVDWDFPITVRGLVEMGRYPALGAFGKFSEHDEEIVQESLSLVDLEEYAERQIKQLSGGQQQRAFLARAWAQQSQIYLLDEPFTGLDTNAKTALRAIMEKLRLSGKILICSHHDTSEVPALFSHVLFLNGELIASGPTSSVFTEENLEAAYSTPVFSGKH